MPDTHTIGSNGETRAALWLEKEGYTIVARNWRTKTGEIDIIASICNVLVFVEVKTLPSGNRDTLAYELDTKKQKRIVKTAKCFLLKHRQYSNSYVRFDVLVIDMPGLTPVYHIESAFSELV